MRHLLIVLMAFICSGTQARAFSCDEFFEVLKANVAEGETYRMQLKSTAPDDASQCHFARDIFIPYTERSIAKVNLYVRCPQHGIIATELAKKLTAGLAVLDTQKVKVCK